MLKHKRRERREEKRRENKRGRRSLCWSFGFSFPGQCLRELLQWETQKLGKLELEKLQLKKVLIPKCGWITVHSLPGRVLAAAGSGRCWEHRVQWESHTVN